MGHQRRGEPEPTSQRLRLVGPGPARRGHRRRWRQHDCTAVSFQIQHGGGVDQIVRLTVGANVSESLLREAAP